MNNSSAKIFVSYERGVLENQAVKHFSTLSFGRFQNEFKQLPGPLFLVNDDVLYASKQISYSPDTTSLLITLPITGKILAGANQHSKTELDVEQVRVDILSPDDTLSIENPYPADWINYLQFGLRLPGLISPQKTFTNPFNITTQPNKLVSLFGAQNELPFSMHMGLYEGRRESIYTFKNEQALLFAFVVSGAFEFEGRLLHERDGLALWDTREVELEALSNGAVIVLLEVENPV